VAKSVQTLHQHTHTISITTPQDSTTASATYSARILERFNRFITRPPFRAVRVYYFNRNKPVTYRPPSARSTILSSSQM
jgi:hypothetical protein